MATIAQALGVECSFCPAACTVNLLQHDKLGWSRALCRGSLSTEGVNAVEIEKLLVALPRRTTAELVQQRLNVTERLDLPGQRDLAKVRDAIDAELVERLEAPLDGWSGGTQGEPRYLRRDGQVLAVVYRRATHGADRGDYGIEIGGRALSDHPRHVEDARELAESKVTDT